MTFQPPGGDTQTLGCSQVGVECRRPPRCTEAANAATTRIWTACLGVWATSP